VSSPNPQGLFGQVWIAADPTRVGYVSAVGCALE